MFAHENIYEMNCALISDRDSDERMSNITLSKHFPMPLAAVDEAVELRNACRNDLFACLFAAPRGRGASVEFQVRVVHTGSGLK
jgi:hypothetical protein